MDRIIYIDKSYSTTRLVTRKQPIIENKFDDKFESILFLPEGEGRQGEGGLRTQEYFKSSFEDKPLITVVTVVFNGEQFLEETILSVINQSYDNVEYIIIDGGSTDGTLDIVRRYEHAIDYWVSEKDNGVYDAINKGLVVAVGEYIGILNADDYYKTFALEHSIEKIVLTKSDYSIAEVQYVNGSIMRPIYPLKKDFVYQEMPYPHVSALISKGVYKVIGLFDTKFKIAGDHDMAVRINMEGYQPCYIREIIATLEEGGISSCLESNRESLKVAIKQGKSRLLAYATYCKQLASVYLSESLPFIIVNLLKKIKGSRFQ